MTKSKLYKHFCNLEVGDNLLFKNSCRWGQISAMSKSVFIIDNTITFAYTALKEYFVNNGADKFICIPNNLEVDYE